MAELDGNLRIRAGFTMAKLGGGIVYFADRKGLPSTTVECRVLDWGEAALLMDGGRDSCTLTLSNLPLVSTSLGTDKRASEYWDDTYPPEGTRVQFEFAVDDNGLLWETYFVGAIREVSSITERQVVIQIDDLGAKFYRRIGDPITTTNYPQAPEEVLGQIQPIVFNFVEEIVPPLVRDRKKAALVDAILATEIAGMLLKKVTSTKGWPVTGSLRINDEIFTYDNTLAPDDKHFLLTARAVSGTAAGAHAAGDAIVEIAQMEWLIAGHAINEMLGTAIPTLTKTTVYGVSTKDTLQLLANGTDYTIDNTSAAAKVKLVSDQGLKVKFPSQEPTYRRYEMDAEGTPVAAAHYFGMNVETGGLQAKNALMACGDAKEWGPHNFAVMDKVAHDTLSVRRTAAIVDPPAAPTKTYLSVEHFGVGTFGPYQILLLDMLDSAAWTSCVLDALDKFLPQFALQPIGPFEIIVDDEVMGVNFFANSTITVTRGKPDINGTTTQIKKHYAGARVHLYRVAGTYFRPNIKVFLESGVGTGIMQQIGVLDDQTDIPPELTEKENGYQEAKTLSAWHGHNLQGIPIAGKAFDQQGQFGISSGVYAYDTSLGDLIIATIRTTTNAAGNQLRTPLHADSLWNLNMTGENDTLQLIFNAYPGLNMLLGQRILAMRWRFLLVGNVRLRMWVGDGVGGEVLIRDATVQGSSSWPPKQAVVEIKIDNTTQFPDGFNINKLFSNRTLVKIDALTDTPQLFYAYCDLDFDEQQLLPGSVEFLSERQAVYGTPSIVVNTGGGTYSNAGKITTPSGLPTPDADAVIELFDNTLPERITSTSSGFQARNEQGTIDGIVRFTTSPSGVNDVSQVEVYWQHPTPPGNATIKRVGILCQAIGGSSTNQPSWRFIQGANVYTPTSESSGSMTLKDGQSHGMARRSWRAEWVMEGFNLTVREFVKSCKFRVTAQGSGSGAWYTDDFTCYMEVDADRADELKPEKADQFTRVRYFDVSSFITDYSQVVGRRVELRWDHVPPPPFGVETVVKEDVQRTVLIPRVWWTFKYEGTVEEELERIAVTTDGISPLSPLAPSSSIITQVLVGQSIGIPALLGATFGDLDVNSFAALGLKEAPGDVPQLAGVLDESMEADQLLATLTQQARCSGFWENGKFRVAFKPYVTALGPPVTVFSSSDGTISEDSLEIQRVAVGPDEEDNSAVANFVTIKARRDFINGGFKITKTATSPSSVAKYGKRTLEIECDFIRQESGAEVLAKQICQYRAEPEQIVTFQTSLFPQARDLVRGDVIQINHDLIPAISSTRFEVLGIAKAMGSIDSGPPAYEVRAVYRPLVNDVVPG